MICAKILPAKLTVIAVLFLSACVSTHAENETPISFTPSAGGAVLVANGVVDERAPNALRRALDENPAVQTLVLQWVPGSMDDEANLEAGRMVRARGLTTVVPQDGLVASGGTDLFLAGAKRKIEDGACVGVHSWAGDAAGENGSELPKDDPSHVLYTSYYQEIGVDPAFYWFTLRVAGPDEMYWMSTDDQEEYQMSSDKAANNVGAASGKNPNRRCEERAEKLDENMLLDA